MTRRRPPATARSSSERGPAARDAAFEEGAANADPARDVDRAYAAYDEHPIEAADAWGSLATFRDAAASY